MGLFASVEILADTADTDGDGMSDAFERTHGLNPAANDHHRADHNAPRRAVASALLAAAANDRPEHPGSASDSDARASNDHVNHSDADNCRQIDADFSPHSPGRRA